MPRRNTWEGTDVPIEVVYISPQWDHVSKEWVNATCYPEHVATPTEILDCQSGVEKFNVSVTTGSQESVSQNVQFTDQNAAYTYEVKSEMDPTRSSVDASDATLEEFFSRPIKIAQYEWSTTLSDFHESFDPWELYWENKRVINRISNFTLLRATMNVKIVINGNGFHYGRLLASYVPLQNEDDFTVVRAFFPQDNIQASQRPHVYLDPTTSQGGSLVLPFFWYRNALSIPASQWRGMGEVTISELVRLKHANGAADRVTISVFAWASNVNMSLPTSSVSGSLSPQSAEEPLDCQAADEYARDGIISTPASTIARVAGSLASVPAIGPFARATQMAASATAGIARMFGYSRPAVLADIVPYKPTVMGNLANSNVADSVFKLTLDAKQELTVDPRITGLSGVDEMSIKSIACRESYLTQFPWEVGAIAESGLFRIEVNPVVWDTRAIGANTEIHMPACCFAALPFTYWRGSMKYRFQVVSSNFHKGRLKFVWDPYGFESNEYNTNYTYIIDIAEDKDFTVEIGWGSENSFLAHRAVNGSTKLFYNSVPLDDFPPRNLGNGVLAVFVVNELTVPNSTVNNDIMINVFVSAGDDFEVNSPEHKYITDLTWFAPTPPSPALNFETLRTRTADDQEPHLDPPTGGAPLLLDPQSGEDLLQNDTENTTEPSAPMQTDIATTMGETTDATDNMLLVHFGEAITSFRQCLKRYNLHVCVGIGASGPTWYRRVQNNMPYHKGYAPGSIHGDYNYANTTLLNYLLPAYTGYRGSMRWKYQLFGGDANFNSYMSATRVAFNNNGNGYKELLHPEWGVDTPAFMAYEGLLRLPHSWPGSTATATRSNPVVEVELPYVSPTRFSLAKEANLTTTGFNDYYHRVDLQVSGSAGDTAPSAAARLACFNAIGEDFGLYFFTGSPIAYFEPLPAPP